MVKNKDKAPQPEPKPCLPPWARFWVQIAQWVVVLGVAYIASGILSSLIPDPQPKDGELFKFTVTTIKDIILVLVGFGGGAGAVHLARKPRR